ncbi:MAG: phosphoribosylanthranilate isomerase, partial [Candidatus Zixiibacteriota bacterium]
IHGYDSARLVRQLIKYGVKTIESFHITKMSDYANARKSKAEIVQLDNRTKGPGGGTGQRFDWSIKPPHRIPNLMLAGGLNAENVSQGVRIFQPLIVDVNSGVEVSPGIKSAAKLKQFFKVCNGLRYGTDN